MLPPVPSPPPLTSPGPSRGGLLALGTLAFVLVVVLLFPTMRVFMAISAAIGVVVAVILHFWNQRPVKPKPEENKRPLGLE